MIRRSARRTWTAPSKRSRATPTPRRGSTTRQHGGLGLGLAIVKHLVELHGGHVSADSEGENRGATFAIELPLTAPVVAPPSQVESIAAAAEPVSLEGVRVLLVEDDRD